MVKNYVKLIVALVFATNLMAQNVPNYVPTNGLIGWWPFNGNANDESGNGNHGTVNGATLTADRNGKVNSAYSFNGINNYIFAKCNSDFVSSNLTISFWVKFNVISQSGLQYLTYGSSTNSSWACSYSNSKPNFIKNQGCGTPIYTTHNFNFQTNNWYHVCYTITNSMVSLYINGNIISTQNLGQFNLNCQSNIINFGLDVFGTYEYLSGQLDDISILKRICNQDEITALYTGTPTCTNPTAFITPQGNTTFCQGGFVNLNASTGANYTYEWYNNGQLINGATASVYQASASGNYTVKVIDGACDATSTATTVTVNPNPTATITPQGNTTFCQGGFVNLVASGGTSYQWNTGSSAPTFSATQSGTYTVNVFNSFGCQATASQQVIVNPLPNVTLNALNQFTLKNASPIQLVASPTGGTFSGDGVQGATFTPANVTLGKKTIMYNYTSPQGCSGVASRSTIIADTLGNVCSTYDTLKVKFKLTTGIKSNQYTTMNVYPNPTSDVIIIEASDVAALNGYSYKLFDVQGKEVYNALVTNTKTEISMKTFGKAGVYILHVVDANNVSIETKQIVLE